MARQRRALDAPRTELRSGARREASPCTSIVLGTKRDIERFLAIHRSGSFLADFLCLRGTMNGGRAGVGGWTWGRNVNFLDDAIDRGVPIILVTCPDEPIYCGGNTYQRELRYLQARGMTWRRTAAYWRVVPAARRPRHGERPPGGMSGAAGGGVRGPGTRSPRTPRRSAVTVLLPRSQR